MDKVLRYLAIANMIEGCIVVLLQVRFSNLFWCFKELFYLAQSFVFTTVGYARHAAQLGGLDLHRILGWWTDDFMRHVDSAKEVLLTEDLFLNKKQ